MTFLVILTRRADTLVTIARVSLRQCQQCRLSLIKTKPCEQRTCRNMCLADRALARGLLLRNPLPRISTGMDLGLEQKRSGPESRPAWRRPGSGEKSPGPGQRHQRSFSTGRIVPPVCSVPCPFARLLLNPRKFPARLRRSGRFLGVSLRDPCFHSETVPTAGANSCKRDSLEGSWSHPG